MLTKIDKSSIPKHNIKGKRVLKFNATSFLTNILIVGITKAKKIKTARKIKDKGSGCVIYTTFSVNMNKNNMPRVLLISKQKIEAMNITADR